jgi:hypothetical protein
MFPVNRIYCCGVFSQNVFEFFRVHDTLITQPNTAYLPCTDPASLPLSPHGFNGNRYIGLFYLILAEECVIVKQNQVLIAGKRVPQK